MNDQLPFKPSRPPMLVADAVKTSGSKRWKALRIFVSVVTLVTIALMTSLYMWLNTLGVFNLDLNRLDALRNFTYQDNSVVFDRNGVKIGEFFEKYHVFAAYDELPQHFIDALISIEDRNFYEHHGIDPMAILRAIYVRVKTGHAKQGASTLTQQLVRKTLLTNEKSLDRKVLEIAWALETERQIPKEKILEIYVNSMFLGNGAYGVGAAARRYFGKALKDLTPAESALIAGLYQSPSRYNPTKYPERARKRQQQVITAMLKNQKITVAEAASLNSQEIKYSQYKFMNTSQAPWFVDYIQEIIAKTRGKKFKNAKTSGLRIYTSIDMATQRLAETAIKSHDSQLTELNKRAAKVLSADQKTSKPATIEAAMLVTDPHSGEILAMVGGRDYKKSQFNRTTDALRSPGSAFKPIVYTEALSKGFKWSDVIFVSPVNIENYRPKNTEDDYLTETTMMRAFYRSMNAPTMEIATQLGIHPIIERASSLGIRSPIKEEFGSALGSSDVTMLDLARLYGSFATGGSRTEITPITKITTADGQILWEPPKTVERQKRVLNSQIAYLMTQGMRAVLTSGTGHTSSDLAQFAAGKTGTSNNSADNWFCGYTPDMVSIVWVGTDEHAPILANASGGVVALPIWDQFIRSVLKTKPTREFERPDGIIEATVHPLYGHRVKQGARMYFLNDMQPKETESALEKIENNSSGGYRNVFRH